MDFFSIIVDIIRLDTLMYVFLGTVFGLVFGAIPGLTAMLAVIILIPLTYGMSTVSGISMLVGVYIGGISGGLVAAILLGMPGTPSSITTVFDGFPLAKKGQAGRALGIGITSNLVGCLLGWVCLVIAAPLIAHFAVRFGPIEYVAVVTFGFTAVISLSGDCFWKACVMTLFGLLISTVGIDPINGMTRNTFDFVVLEGGISFVPALIGLFIVAQVFSELEDEFESFIIPPSSIGKITMTLREFRESLWNFIRSGAIGIFIGILPGIGGALGNIVAYDQAKKAAPNPETFGTGDIQGIVASETSNNALIGGALIPLLALGIPGDAVTAALLGGLQIHGIEAGPLLAKEHPEILYSVFVYYLWATICMYVVMRVLGIKLFPIILRVKKSYLLPVVLICCLIGCYNINNDISDVWASFIFGLVGYFLNKYKYPLVPIVITLILGPMFEKQLRIAMVMTDGSLMPFVTTPISLIFLMMAAISVAIPLMNKKKNIQNNADKN